MTPGVPIRPEARPASLLHQIAWLTEQRADHPAVILIDGQADTTISYGQLFSSASQAAVQLQAIGVRRGDLVVLVLEQSAALLYTFWGAMLIGAVPSIFPFLNDKLDRERYFESLHTLIAHEQVRAVIATPDLLPPLRSHLAAIPGLDVIAIEALASGDAALPALDNPASAPDDTAFLQHSSGSTGLQKGVMLSHRAVINQIASYSQAIGLRGDDVIVSWLPLYHDMGLIAGCVLPIMQGVPLVLLSPFQWVREPHLLLHAITRHRGTLCWLPNFAYNFMAARLRDAALVGVDLTAMRAFINCSEPVFADSHRLFARRFQPYGLHPDALLTCYAMAENTFAVTQSAIGRAPDIDRVDRRAVIEARQARPAGDDPAVPAVEFVSCGRPIPQVQVAIVDEAGARLDERQIGEIILQSDSMLSGYFRRDDLTAAALRDGWYLTGDMGYLVDGALYITGRKKDLIIVGGKNIYPQDLEMLLNDLPGVYPGRVVAFGVDNPTLGTEDVAIVVEVDDPALLDDPERGADVQRAIRARIAQHTEVTARHVQLVPHLWLIKTSSGKIARAANREKFLALLNATSQG